MAKKTRKIDLREDPSYQDLVASIGKIIDDAYVKGVDFNRQHFLNCYACGCVEGMTEKGNRAIYLKDGTAAGLDVDFRVIDVKRRDYVLKRGGLRWRTTYLYVCGICGAEQKVCHLDEFSKQEPH